MKQTKGQNHRRKERKREQIPFVDCEYFKNAANDFIMVSNHMKCVQTANSIQHRTNTTHFTKYSYTFINVHIIGGYGHYIIDR